MMTATALPIPDFIDGDSPVREYTREWQVMLRDEFSLPVSDYHGGETQQFGFSILEEIGSGIDEKRDDRYFHPAAVKLRERFDEDGFSRMIDARVMSSYDVVCGATFWHLEVLFER